MLIYNFVSIIRTALTMVSIKQYPSSCKVDHCQYLTVISNIYNNNVKILSTKIYKNTKMEIFISNNTLNIEENYMLCNIHFNLLALYMHFKKLKIKQLPTKNYKLFYNINYNQINIDICKLRTKFHAEHLTFTEHYPVHLYKLLMYDEYIRQMTQLLIQHIKLYYIKLNNKKYIIGENHNKIIFINVNGVQENIIFTNSNQFCNPKLELQWTINRKILKSKEIEYLKHTLLDYLLEKEIYLNSEHCSSIIISDEFKIIITIIILFIIFFYLTLRFYNIIPSNISAYIYRHINNYIFQIYK